MVIAAIHHYVNARWQHLHKGQCAAHVKKSVRRSTKGIGNHCPREYDGLAFNLGIRQVFCGFNDGIGAVGKQNPGMLVPLAIVRNDGSICIGHLQAVDHHQGFDIYIKGTAPGDQHFGQVGILKIQFAFDVIVFFVEGAAGNEDLNHDWVVDRDALHRVSINKNRLFYLEFGIINAFVPIDGFDFEF